MVSCQQSSLTLGGAFTRWTFLILSSGVHLLNFVSAAQDVDQPLLLKSKSSRSLSLSTPPTKSKCISNIEQELEDALFLASDEHPAESKMHKVENQSVEDQSPDDNDNQDDLFRRDLGNFLRTNLLAETSRANNHVLTQISGQVKSATTALMQRARERNLRNHIIHDNNDCLMFVDVDFVVSNTIFVRRFQPVTKTEFDDWGSQISDSSTESTRVVTRGLNPVSLLQRQANSFLDYMKATRPRELNWSIRQYIRGAPIEEIAYIEEGYVMPLPDITSETVFSPQPDMDHDGENDDSCKSKISELCQTAAHWIRKACVYNKPRVASPMQGLLMA